MDVDLNSSRETENSNSGDWTVKDEYVTSYEGENDDSEPRTLYVGESFKSLDDVYNLYCEHARTVGFCVKKETQAYFKGSLDLKLKVYLCSCEGNPDPKRCADRTPDYRRQMVRSGCKARHRVLRKKLEGTWRVSVFADEHNHELVPRPNSYLLRSARSLTPEKAKLVESFLASRIGVSKAHRYMSKEAGGVHNVGFLLRDAYQHLGRLSRKIRAVDGDSKALLDWFNEKKDRSPGFYWKADVDLEGRLFGFFLRDAQSAIDYEYFGDVMSVDTTYKTNKFNLHCMSFIGINHHGRNVMFGIGFLRDETTSAFEWMFRTFLNSMKGKEPQVIFTDQCMAMMNALDGTFKTASHRLCQWHLNRNAPSNFGRLKSNKSFMSLWRFMTYDCETVDEFEVAWAKMREEFPETNRSWFDNMYNMRARWAAVFTNTKFSGGVHTTSRSESTNRAMKEVCSYKTSLSDFVVRYEELVRDWRLKESEADVANRGVPGLRMSNGFLEDLAGIYTRRLTRKFEFEAVHCLELKYLKEPKDVTQVELKYELCGKPASIVRKITFNRLTNDGRCSCRMWETKGVLCRHILKIYFDKGVSTIPQHLVLRRWMGSARDRLTSLYPVSGSDLEEVAFVSRNQQRMYNLACLNRANVTRRVTLDKRMEDLVIEYQKTTKKDFDTPSKKRSRNNTFRDPRLLPKMGGKPSKWQHFDTPNDGERGHSEETSTSSQPSRPRRKVRRHQKESSYSTARPGAK